MREQKLFEVKLAEIHLLSVERRKFMCSFHIDLNYSLNEQSLPRTALIKFPLTLF